MDTLKGSSETERRILMVGALLSAVLLLLQYYRWEIIEIVTPFFQWPLEMVIYGLFFGVFGLAIYSGIHKSKANRKKFLALAAFMLAVYLITVFVNFNGLWIDHYFNQHKAERNEVIRMISDGRLRPNVAHDPQQIHLPSPLDKTSMGGGDIIFSYSDSDKQAFFFSFRGILDSYAGFFFSSKDNPPTKNSMGLEFRNFIKLEAGWYWIGTCNPSKNSNLGALLNLAPILRCN